MTITRRLERSGTNAFLASNNPTPGLGELIFDTDHDRLKIGDGATPYNALDFADAFARGFSVNLRDPFYGRAPNDRTGDVGVAFNTILGAIRSPLSVGGSGSFNFQTYYGGTVHVPPGIYNIDTPISVPSAVVNDRIALRIKGENQKSCILYTATLSSLLQLAASASFFSMEDISIVVYTDLSGASSGSPANIVQLIGVLAWYMRNVTIYVRNAGQENIYVRPLYLQDSYYGVMQSCRQENFAQQLVQPSKHSVSGGSTYARLSGCGIYSKNNNALVIRDNAWGNIHRCMTLESDDGVLVSGGNAEFFNQGFAFIGDSNGNRVEGVRFESHPESTTKFLGNGTPGHWFACFGERTFDNDFDVPNCGALGVDNTRNGIIDLSGSNFYRMKDIAKTRHVRSFTPNGTGAASHSTLWTPSGSATITDITSDLPPDQLVVSAMQLAATGNIAGATMAPFFVDPERMSAMVYRYWGKRASGQQQMRYMLETNVSGQYLATDLSRSTVTQHVLSGKTISLSGATWSGGVATYTTDMDNHWLVTGQNAGVTGMALAGYNTAGQVTVIDATHFSLPVASDPGGAGGSGTCTRFSYESEFSDLNSWNEYKGVFSFRGVIVGISANGTQVTYTFSAPHRVPNNAGCQFKAFGIQLAGYNGVFSVVSTTSLTVTVANTTTGSPAAGFDGVALGFGGYYGNVTPRLGNEGSGSTTWKMAGFQHFPGSDRQVIPAY